MMQLVQKYMQIHWSDKLLLIETLFLLVVIKIVILTIPLRWYAKLLGIQNGEKEHTILNPPKHKIFKISAAIVRSRKVIPWKNQCLTEAITGKVLLRQYGLPGTLVLGVRKENITMAAHAWLLCGDIFVAGRRGMHKFNVVSTFS